jgi:hypothetical protein
MVFEMINVLKKLTKYLRKKVNKKIRKQLKSKCLGLGDQIQVNLLVESRLVFLSKPALVGRAKSKQEIAIALLL